MQESIPRKSAHVVAPDPTRRIALFYFICVGTIVMPLIVLYYLPGQLHNVFEWQSSPSAWRTVAFLLDWAIPVLVGLCFFPFMQQSLSRKWRWKKLEDKRQQVAAASLQGSLPVQFPLPVVATPLPTTLSIHTRRSWCATGIAIIIFTLLWGFSLVNFVFNWQMNMHSFAQEGQIGWILLKTIVDGALYSFPVLLAFLAIILAPRQQILATQDGLFCHLGPHASCIPWHEARLFSVIAEQDGILVYELASKTNIIRWSSTLIRDNFPFATIGSTPFRLAQADPSLEEYEQHIRLLTVLVADRTGLPLSDLR